MGTARAVPGGFPARLWIPLLAGALLLLGASPPGSEPAQPQPVVDDHLTVLTLRGSHYEAGLAHGTALREPIHELVELWKRDIHERFGADPDAFLSGFMGGTDFLPAIRKWAPSLLEEVRGISDGAGIPFNTMLAYQFVDEIWVAGDDPPVHKCTTIALRKSADHPCFLAENLDIPRFYHLHRVLLRFRGTESGIGQDVLTVPGYLGACGLNGSSVGVGANALPDLKHTRNGLPVSFIVRSALERRTFGEAVTFLRQVRHAAAQNYMLADSGAAGSFECSDTTVAEFLPVPGAGFTFHTNLPVVNRNHTDTALALLAAQGLDTRAYAESCPRLRFLRHTFGERPLGPGMLQGGMELLKRLLRNRDSGVNNLNTFGSVIMVLGPSPELHVAAGRPDEASFQVFRFDVE
jgi:isopenicillin-N N-acyltransferase like protein